MRRRQLLTYAAAAAAAACASSPASTAPPTIMAAPSGADVPDSPLAAHPASGRWPDVVARAPADVREAYAFAVDNYASLRSIPCYCGCGLSAGHRDNFDCYVKQPLSGGWSILDAHALG